MKPVYVDLLELNVRLEVYLDDYIHTDFEDYDDATKEALVKGTLSQFVVVVKAFDITGNVAGLDSLGGIIVKKAEDVLDTVKDHNMVDNAKTELLFTLNKIFKAYGKV